MDGKRWFSGRWFYQAADTTLLEVAALVDKRRVWLAEYNDSKTYVSDNTLDCIARKAIVKKIRPGDQPPPQEECDFWYDQLHAKKFCSFSDSFGEDMDEADSHHVVEPASDTVESLQYDSAGNAKDPRVLNVLDLYAGCGGLSFLAQEVDGVKIVSRWAVDFSKDASMSFKVNHPHAAVRVCGVDEYLCLLQRWKELCDRYPPDWSLERGKGNGTADLPSDGGSQSSEEAKRSGEGTGRLYEVEKILDMRIEENADRGLDGQSKGNLLGELKLENCWLTFLVKWKGYEDITWEPEENLTGCEGSLNAFVQSMRSTGDLPLPGDVDVVVGGPPCQGVSGLNRHRARGAAVLRDPKNRQMNVFLKVVEFLRPRYCLMENVPDILKHEDGVIAKAALAALLSLRYQARMGILAAGHYGVPEWRARVFIWGAMSGERLPPFPMPTHRSAANTKSSVMKNREEWFVGFASTEEEEAALPALVLGDVLGDLGPVETFTFSENATYCSEPQTPAQAYLRRLPRSGTISLAERAMRAEMAMHPSNVPPLERQLLLSDQDLGTLYLTKGGSTYAKEVREAAQSHLSAEKRAHLAAELAQSRKEVAIRTGKEVRAAIEVALSRTVAKCLKTNRAEEQQSFVSGILRDHRALCLNVDDLARCAAVPMKKGANFRDLEGVITHADGTCCAGHTHSVTACPGPPTRTAAPRSTGKEGRVDQHDKGGWRGDQLKGCPAKTVWLPTGELLCPRWCITYKLGRSNGRHGCFGRCWYDEVVQTVVGRAEPHNLRLVHPCQDRVLSIRENSRIQGFPDYFVLTSFALEGERSGVRSCALTQRYQQIGNAVSPAVASALGRCLAKSVARKVDPSKGIVHVPDPEWTEALEYSKAHDLKFWEETHKVLEESNHAVGKALNGTTPKLHVVPSVESLDDTDPCTSQDEEPVPTENDALVPSLLSGKRAGAKEQSQLAKRAKVSN